MERAAERPIQASPIAADGRIYFLNTDGLTTIVSAALRFDKLIENQLDDTTTASPAISDGKLFIRGISAVLPWAVARGEGLWPAHIPGQARRLSYGIVPFAKLGDLSDI